MTTALTRLEDTPQMWGYRFSGPYFGRCCTCGVFLDGDSRFWCRRHYRHLGTMRIAVERFKRKRPAFA